MAEHTQKTGYQLGDFTVDAGSRELKCADEVIPLTPKEFQTLLLLVEARGQAVDREFMLRTIWPDTVVGDTSLGRNISVLRRHLGRDSIKSISKFGYRLTLPVVSIETPNVVHPVSEVEVGPPIHSALFEPVAATRPWWSRRPFAMAALALFAATIVLTLGAHRVSEKSQNREATEAAAHWDDLGMFALREGTYFKASKAFQQATRLDPRSAMAHAHLAEAYLQLEFPELARSEVLLASDHERTKRLTALEQHYLEAVRASAVRDFPAATKEYKAILDQLPDDAKSSGLEDLGRAYQRQGRIPDAIASYEEAARLQPANAGVQLHLGLLKGLERDRIAAEAYYDRALVLYDASTNLEGVAEVNYQRGCMAYVNADYSRAETFLNTSLEVARKIADSQLEGRSLGALSTVQRWEGKLDQSAATANLEIAVSRAAGSSFGYAEGVMLLANLALARRDAAASESLLAQAVSLAEQNGNPRLEANAEFSMADLYDATGRYEQEIASAQRARQHYESYGSVDGAADASMSIIRGETGAGNFMQALTDAEALLAHSEATHSEVFAEDSEEAIGNIQTDLENDPEALLHYRRALDLARKTRSEVPLKSLDVAGALVRIGRLREAATMLSTAVAEAQKDPDARRKLSSVLVEVDLGQGRYEAAIALARKASHDAMAPAAAAYFIAEIARAESRSGQVAPSTEAVAQLEALGRETRNAFVVATAQLAGAQAALMAGSPAQAETLASQAALYFHTNTMRQSECAALVIEARARHAVNDLSGSLQKAAQARAVLAEIERDWPAEDFAAYRTRPDVRQAMQKLDALAPITLARR